MVQNYQKGNIRASKPPESFSSLIHQTIVKIKDGEINVS